MKHYKNKDAQVTGVVVKLVIALVVIGMLIFIGYKYILGTGERIGGLSGCPAQAKGAECKSPSECTGTPLPGLCEKATEICCIPPGS
jgi:hypothetical protein